MKCEAKLKIVPGDPTTYTWKRKLTRPRPNASGLARPVFVRVRVAHQCGKMAMGSCAPTFTSKHLCQAHAKEAALRQYEAAKSRREKADLAAKKAEGEHLVATLNARAMGVIPSRLPGLRKGNSR